MKTIDKSVLAGYNAGIEKNRLRSGIGLIEFERTKELLLEKTENWDILSFVEFRVVFARMHVLRGIGEGGLIFRLVRHV